MALSLTEGPSSMLEEAKRELKRLMSCKVCTFITFTGHFLN
ncbi:uncharacterized protein G2W53_007423 [Senna tora]|uniref:Uncharacterized protein n=1 Tax=Senna tora TaxID=362788 RepID=A0A834X645_9FABA|nr:uncharacterized protein G2W53_007423 [Senna tora]